MKWRFIFAAFFVGLSLHTFAATVYTDKIEIVDGSLPHLVYSRNKGVNFAVDAYGSDGWKVTVHHERGWGYVAEGVVGSAVNNQTFSNDLYSVTGTGDIFRVAFRWWYKDAQTTIYHYGWFTLSKQDDALVVVASEVSDDPSDTIVGRGEPNLPEPIEPPDIRWHFTDHGDWLSLPRGCISEEVSGWLDIPPQLNGPSRPSRRRRSSVTSSSPIFLFRKQFRALVTRRLPTAPGCRVSRFVPQSQISDSAFSPSVHRLILS